MNAVHAEPLTRLPDLPGTPSPALLPVLPELAGLLPSAGLRRGSTVAIHPGPGSTSLLLALLAAASAAGAWCGVVGWPELGGLAAVELGVVPARLIAVPDPGASWLVVASALLDGGDLVVVRPPARIDARDALRLSARARERQSTLLVAGEWPGAELRLSTTDSRWFGLEHGAGHLVGRELAIQAHGRGAAARPRSGRLWFSRALTGTGTPDAGTPDVRVAEGVAEGVA
ncbi:MAG: hypothetical protein HYR62_04045 [Actinobacteria bacterium]|nr:hypothetical protein [Actinomycetota bacterium]MBI3686689.1 hypothetical protein [Actinomycetota bacterium]